MMPATMLFLEIPFVKRCASRFDVDAMSGDEVEIELWVEAA